MNINLKKRDVTLKEIICSKYEQTKAECDLIVPDSKPDISKILQVCGKAVVTQKIPQQDKVYIQGVIHLTVIYIPEGGGIKSIFTNLDFSCSAEAQGTDSTSHIFAESELFEVDHSTLNSRKINIKCLVGIDIKTSRKTIASLPTDFSEECKVQAKYKDYKISCISPEEEQCFRFRERVEVPSGKPDICEMIKISASCSVEDLKYDNGKVSVSGDILLCALYADEACNLICMEETLPFSETLEGIALPEGEIEGSFLVSDIVFDLPEEPDGSRRAVNIDLLICSALKSIENVEVKGISDAYGLIYPVKIVSSTYETESVTDKAITQIAHKESVSVPDYLPEIFRVLDCSGETRVTGISIDQGRITVDGEILSNIIYMSDGDNAPMSGLSHISSFSQTIDTPYADKNSICEAKVELDHIGYNINSDREIELRFIVVLSVSTLKADTIEIIEEISEDTDGVRPLISPATIYFADEGETVWDIAKKYLVTPESIISENNLEGDTLKKGQKICIFR